MDASVSVSVQLCRAVYADGAADRIGAHITCEHQITIFDGEYRYARRKMAIFNCYREFTDS